MELRLMRSQDLEMVRTWRNDPGVRRNMYTHHEIDAAEHQRWWDRHVDNPYIHRMIAEADGVPVGFALMQVDPNNIALADWAFYKAPDAPPGTGKAMERAVIERAFNDYAIVKLSCEVLSYNEPVIRMHQKHGFQLEGIFRQAHFYEDAWHDIHRLALFKDDWKDVVTHHVGKTVTSRASFSGKDIAAFAELVGDTNPIHFGAKPIAHGMLVGATFSRVFGTIFPGPGSTYLRQTVNFVAPVVPSQALDVKVTVLTQIRRKMWFQTKVVDVETGITLLEGEALVLLAKE